MSDPDMGSWSYTYYNNGNLYTQTDAKSQTITMVYDALNRLTNKNYPGGSGMTNVVYSHDSTTGGNYGKGQRTSMTDYFGTNGDNWKYDTRGRLIREDKIVDSVTYTTQYTYDGADRIATITYPTNEVVTQTYNGRGLPYTLSGTTAGSLVTSALYNQLGSMTEINLNNSTKTTFGYYGTGGTYDTTGGYYGRLWEIKTTKQPGGTPVLQDVKHTWDAGANLTQRQDLVSSETENFTYDNVDRLTGVSGAYTESFSYNEIGNITSKNGTGYNYGTKPHAVTAVGSSSYVYDNNGNMTTRGTQTITWDVDNKPVTVTGGSTYYYDGDGNRVKEIDGSTTTVYINQYYEKNITTSEITTHYYLGGKQIAVRKGSAVSYLLQEHLGSTSVIADTTGASTGTVRYFPFGLTRSTSGTIPTDKKFTGQRLDSTGLYFYNARYYDANIGRFISPDTIVPNPINPQAFNRYSYTLNNPLKYTDPSGHFAWAALAAAATPFLAIPGVQIVAVVVIAVSVGVIAYQAVNYFENQSKNPYDPANSIPMPEIKGPTKPDETNIFPDGPPNLGPGGKIIVGAVAVAVAGVGAEAIEEGLSSESKPIMEATRPEPANLPDIVSLESNNYDYSTDPYFGTWAGYDDSYYNDSYYETDYDYNYSSETSWESQYYDDSFWY